MTTTKILIGHSNNPQQNLENCVATHIKAEANHKK